MAPPSKLFLKLTPPSVWEDICDKEKNESPFVKKAEPEVVDFDPAKTSPVFYGCLFGQVPITDADALSMFDPAKGHPAAVGFAFLDRLTEVEPPEAPAKEAQSEDFKSVSSMKTSLSKVDPKSCSAKTYMQELLFPVLLPGLHEMIFQAKREKCFERKRTKFNACDFLTEWLYNRNPKHPHRMDSPQSILEIPFCKEFSMDHPREALPLSLLLSDEQAVTIIQSHWRGFCVRRQPEIASLRSWQREWNEMNQDVRNKMAKFWHTQGLFDGRSSASTQSGEGEEKTECILTDA